MDNPRVVYKGIVLSLTNGGSSATCHDVAASQGITLSEMSQSERKEHVCLPLCELPRMIQMTGTESGMLAVPGAAEGGGGLAVSQAQSFRFARATWRLDANAQQCKFSLRHGMYFQRSRWEMSCMQNHSFKNLSYKGAGAVA